MKLLITVLAVMFVILQVRLWAGDGGVREVRQYQSEIKALSSKLEDQQDINSALRAEVKDLEDGLGEIEARARSELGMIGKGETFYQFVGEKVDVGPALESDNLARVANKEKRDQQIQ